MKKNFKIGVFVVCAGWVFIFATAFTQGIFGKSNEQTKERKAIDYSDPKNWAYFEKSEEKFADVFIVCPTVDLGKNGNYNMDIADESLRASFVGALNMERGIYDVDANMFAPFYRQATFPVYEMKPELARQYFEIAYSDVRDAFRHYLSVSETDRPFILAGFSQGSDMVLRLMKEFLDNDTLQSRFIAAYCIGWKLTQDDVAAYPWLKPAKGEFDTGVIISFNSESEKTSSSILVGENEKTLAINPLNWKTDCSVAKANENIGACFTNYDGVITKEEPALCGAYLKKDRGTLAVTNVTPADYPGILFEDGIYHLYDYQFFYRNLQKNVRDRIKMAIKTN